MTGTAFALSVRPRGVEYSDSESDSDWAAGTAPSIALHDCHWAEHPGAAASELDSLRRVEFQVGLAGGYSESESIIAEVGHRGTSTVTAAVRDSGSESDGLKLGGKARLNGPRRDRRTGSDSDSESGGVDQTQTLSWIEIGAS